LADQESSTWRGEIVDPLNFPPPIDDPAFERLMAQLAQPVLNAQTVNLNGRQGQAQHGVDVSVLLPDDTYAGIQCKLTTKALTIATVKEEIAKAQDYKPTLSRFIVATTAPSDAPLQQASCPSSPSSSKCGTGARSTSC
jgi:hypothetical protein